MADIDGAFIPAAVSRGMFNLSTYVLLLFNDDFFFVGEDDFYIREEYSEGVDGNINTSFAEQGALSADSLDPEGIYKTGAITRGTYG